MPSDEQGKNPLENNADEFRYLLSDSISSASAAGERRRVYGQDEFARAFSSLQEALFGFVFTCVEDGGGKLGARY